MTGAICSVSRDSAIGSSRPFWAWSSVPDEENTIRRNETKHVIRSTNGVMFRATLVARPPAPEPCFLTRCLNFTDL